ncbi:BRAP2 RING ZnF UBP domain-containing protein 1 [Camellia lanceoleosa]|uniref:BRAP2 RING ZnF UBP domain-containing protein 1 n=1 Tax=Camellia lanceoleosa TaxID=1840588 RepID=A0ACC0IH34_9ERIC|nr:BRAP2 RING ZnF UBP domain-containing protein 1 [Camellia lanceoleosa]
MFILQIHSIDTRRPFSSTATTSSSAAKPSNHLSITELNGVVHLFRSQSPSSTTSLTSPSARSTKLFVVAVPNYLSPDDFLLFCGSHLDHFSELCFLRNDGMEDRYSVLITLANQLTADGFYCNFNGKRFRSSQRLYQDTCGIQTTLCDHTLQCPCGSKRTYLSCQVCRLCQQQDEKPSCAVCGTLKNLWVCVICGFVGCGRYEERHAIRHWKDTQHCYSLELETQQVWDYVGDIYVHR